MADIDLRKKGPSNYRELQQANDADFQEAALDPEFAELLQYFDQVGNPRSTAFNPHAQDVQEVTSNTGDYGESMFDVSATGLEGANRVGDIRANNQPWIAQLGAGVGKMVTTAGTTFVSGTAGLLYGIGTVFSRAINEEGFAHSAAGLFDNDVTRAMADIGEEMEKILPNYMSEAENATPWYKRMNTMNFWANNIIKNAGFMIGAYYSGSAYNAAFKALGLLKNGITAQVIGTTMNAVTEGSIEGLNASRDMVNYEKNLIDNHIKQKQDAVIASSMSYEDKAAALSEIEQERNQLLEDLNHRADKVGLVTMGLNIPLLAAQEWFTFGKLYARGFKNSNELASQTIRNATGQTLREGAGALERGAALEAAEGAGERVTREGIEYGWREVGFKGGLARGMRTSLLEGNEEMSQAFVSEYAANLYSPDDPDAYYKSIIDGYGTLQTQNYWDAAVKALADTYGDIDRWEEFAAGFISSALGMPTFGRVQNSDANTWLGRGRAVGLSGGLIGEITNALEQDRIGQQNVDAMNKYVHHLQDNARYFAQSASFTDAMDGYSEEGEEFRYKNMRDNESFAAYDAFRRAGKAADFMEMVKQDFENISDEELDKIAKYTTPNIQLDEDGNVIKHDEQGQPLRGGWREADGSLMSETPEGREKMRQELIKKRDKILKEVAAYGKSLDKVRAASNHALTDDAVEELAWLDWKIGMFNERFGNLFAENKGKIQSLQDALTAYRNENLDENIPTEELPEQYEKYREIVDKLLKYTKMMLQSKSALNLGLRAKVNADFIKAIDEFFKSPLETYEQQVNGQVQQSSLSFLDYLNAYGLGLSESDMSQFTQDFLDMGRLASSAVTFNERFREFMNDPLKLRDNWAKLEAEKRRKEQAQRRNQNRQNLENATVEDVRNAVNNGQLNIEELDDLLNDPEISESLKDAINEFKQIEEEADSILQELEELRNGTNSEAVDSAIAMLAIARENAQSVEELEDLSRQVYNDTTNIDMSEFQDLPTPEEIQEAANGKLEVIKTLLHEAIDTKNKNKQKGQEVPETPSQEEGDDDETTGHDGSPEVPSENKQREEKKDTENNEDESEEDDEEDSGNNNKEAVDADEDLEKQLDELDKDALNEDTLDRNKKKTPLSFWKPTTTRLPIHNPKGNRVPFYQLAKSMKNKDGSPRYNKAELQRMEAVYKFLESHNAYDIIENGELKEGDVIKFKVYKDLNDKAGDFVIIMCDKQGRPLGDIMSESDALAQRQVGLLAFIADIKKAYEEAESPDDFEYEHTSNVLSPMVGKVPYTSNARNQNTTLNDLFKSNPNDLVIGVCVDVNGTIRTTSGSATRVSDEERKIMPPLRISVGKPVIVLKTSDSNRTVAVPFAMPLYKRSRHSDTKLGKAVESVVKSIITHNDSNAIQVIRALKSLLAIPNIGIHYKKDTVKIILTKNGGIKETIYNGDINGVVEPVLEALDGLPFNIDRAHINSEFEGQDYNEMIGELAIVNLDGTHTINDWFTISPISTQGVKLPGSKPPKSIGRNPNAPTRVFKFQMAPYGNIEINYDDKTVLLVDSNKKGNLYSLKTGELNPNTAKVFAYAHGLKTSQDMTKPYDTEWGTYDPVNNKFVEKKVEENTDSIEDLDTKELNDIAQELEELFDNQTLPTAEELDEIKRLQGTRSNPSEDTESLEIPDEVPETFNDEESPINEGQDKTPSEKPSKESADTSSETPAETNGAPSMDVNTATSIVTKKGILSTALRKQVWESLTDEQRIALGSLKSLKMKNAMAFLEKAFDVKTGKVDEKTLGQSIDSLLGGKPKNRLVDNKNRRVFNRQKEMSWLRKVLPNMTATGRVRVVKGLIKLGNDTNPMYSYGQFQNGIITLSDKAAEGTVYHEAFHAVVGTLLNTEEISSLMQAAKQEYGEKSNLELEELLAEDFRRYVQIEQRPVVGFIVRVFRQLKHMVQTLLGNELYVNNLFYRISNGEFANQDFVSQEELQDRSNRAKDTAKIRQYHSDKLLFSKQNIETQEYIKEYIGVSEYNNMSDFMKEVLLRCH